MYDQNTLTRFINFLVTAFSNEIDVERKYNRCSRCSQKSYSDIPLCDACLSYLDVDILKEFLKNFDPSIITSSCNDSNRYKNIEILFDLKHFEEYASRNTECIKCGSRKAPDFIFPSFSYCNRCNNLFDWKSFELDFINGRITWEQFFEDDKIKSKYIYNDYKTKEDWLNLGECI